ncbi:MAG: dTDP-glucose 4,6-dehydratase [Candidatus Omnitrophica bacterium]|nr:dTDP-glucose 4,6-dehydratase [Candidatus Omnitrophota bacterium]
MKLLVTGGAGFIGSNFIRHWLSRHPQDDIRNLDRLTYAGNRANLSDVDGGGRYALLEGDICDGRAVAEAMDGCEAVVHFAAETHVDRSITDPAAFLRTNLEGTGQLLAQAHQRKVPRFLHVSTDEVYGPAPEGVAFRETDPLTPTSPYAASKAGADLLAQAYFRTYRLPVIVARPTNNFGPFQFPEKLIPLFITNAMADAALPVYGDGLQRRNWLFVEDTCRALELLLEQGEPGGVYNIGTASECANLDMTHAILRALGKPETLIRRVADRPGHDRRYAVDCRRLQALGWKPRATFTEALTATVRWYQANQPWWQPLKERLREDSYHWLDRSAGTSAPGAVRASR